MRSAWLCLLGLSLVPSLAVAAEPDLCQALKDLKTEALASGIPQRVGVIKEDVMTFACMHSASAAERAFCNAAAQAVGIEFTHAFPWRVERRLAAEGVPARMETVDGQYTGLRDRKKVMHLWASWRDGARLDIRFEPSGDFGSEKDYWGTYRLVIWRP